VSKTDAAWVLDEVKSVEAMKFSCEECSAQYVLPDEKIGERGVQVRCKRCSYVNTVQRTASQRISEVLEGQPLAHLELTDSSAEGSPVDAMDSMFDAIFDPEDAATSSVALTIDDEPTLDPSITPQEPARDWWVAIDNQQVGPLSRMELEGRISNGTVNRASLVWKTGMANWAPLEDVPELGTLIGRAATERELEKVAGADAQVPQGIHLGDSASVEIDPIEWKPSAATQLSELVQAEMQKEGAQKVSFNTSSPDESSGELPAFRAPSGGSGFAEKESSFSPILILVLVVGVIGVLYAQGLIQIGSDEPVVAQAAALPVAEVKPVVAPEPPTENETVKPVAPVEDKVVESKKSVAKLKTSRSKKVKKSKPKARRNRSKKVDSKPASRSDDEIDDVFKKASGLSLKLPVQQVNSATKKNSASIRPCIRSAIDNREVTPGRHTLELSFVILPNGRVQKSRMAGPYYLQGTSLPKCLATAMRNWRFPKSKEGNRVEKFPIPFKYNP